jgi:hypothetical protein
MSFIVEIFEWKDEKAVFRAAIEHSMPGKISIRV